MRRSSPAAAAVSFPVERSIGTGANPQAVGRRASRDPRVGRPSGADEPTWVQCTHHRRKSWHLRLAPSIQVWPLSSLTPRDCEWNVPRSTPREWRARGTNFWSLTPFEFDLRRVSAKEYEMRVLLESPIPPGLSLLFGEWLYNLRSALDYVVWAAAVHTSRK